MVEADAVVQRKSRVDAPLILNVEAEQVAVLARIVDDGQRNVGRGVAGVIGRESLDGVVALRVLVRETAPEPGRVRIVELVGRVELHADGRVGPRDIRSHAVVDEIAALRIGHVVQLGILVEHRRLVVERPVLLLQRGDDVLILFALVLVEVGGRDRIEAGIDVADAGERKGGGSDPDCSGI